MSRYVVGYDIPDNKRRKRIADILEAYGDRIQKSVFELPVDRRLMEACVTRLKRAMNQKEDSMAIYRQCAKCDQERTYLGTAKGRSGIGDEDVFIV